MMALMKWDSTLSVGITRIDAQHQKLVGLVNKLHDAMMSGTGVKVVGTVLDELVAYTREHFQFEEQLMQLHGYPDLAVHVVEHSKLTHQTVQLQADVKQGTALTMDVMQFLRDWLTGHILGVDRKYTPFFALRNV
jgi:hemerythrin